MPVSHLTALAILTISLFVATPSVADARSACQEDIKTLCASEFRARDRNEVRACLQTNLEKASEKCQVAIKAQSGKNGEKVESE